MYTCVTLALYTFTRLTNYLPEIVFSKSVICHMTALIRNTVSVIIRFAVNKIYQIIESAALYFLKIYLIRIFTKKVRFFARKAGAIIWRVWMDRSLTTALYTMK